MRKADTNRIILYGVFLLLLLGIFSGCGKNSDDTPDAPYRTSWKTEMEAQESAEEDGAKEDDSDLYLILANNSAEEMLHLYRYSTGLEYQYYYSLGTRFLDKYGQSVSAVNFTPGKVVQIGISAAEGRLKDVRISEDVWEQDDIVRFSMRSDVGLFKIADAKYHYGSDVFVFSNGELISLADISENDRLSVVGKDKEILSISVTTGHGMLQLANTELFEGSFMELGNDIFAEIMPDMEMEIPEGNYQLTVAKDGWGGSCNVCIRRGETTTVDLDAMKGDGPSYGKILFEVDVEGASIWVDGEEIDYSQPQKLRYGVHSISVSASGYPEWTKYLYVNSPEATILIGLADENEGSSGGGTSGSGGTSSSESGTDNSEAGGGTSSGTSNSGSGTSSGGGSGTTNSGGTSSGTTNSGGSGSSNSLDYDELMQDYLSTLRWQMLMNGMSSL